MIDASWSSFDASYFIKIYIAVVKEKALGENAAPKEVCPTFWDRPLLREMFAQICKNEAEIYRCSFSAVGQNIAKA